MNRIVYKVCEVGDDVFESARMCTPDFRLTYKVGERVKPVAGRILCFDTLNDAMEFRECGEVVFRAMGYGVREQPFLIGNYCDNTIENIIRVFQPNITYDELFRMFKPMRPPAGTLSAASLKLLEQVTRCVSGS